MSRSHGPQRSRMHIAEKDYNAPFLDARHADVDHYAAYEADAPPVLRTIEPEAWGLMMAATAPGYPLPSSAPSRLDKAKADGEGIKANWLASGDPRGAPRKGRGKRCGLREFFED